MRGNLRRPNSRCHRDLTHTEVDRSFQVVRVVRWVIRRSCRSLILQPLVGVVAETRLATAEDVHTATIGLDISSSSLLATPQTVITGLCDVLDVATRCCGPWLAPITPDKDRGLF